MISKWWDRKTGNYVITRDRGDIPNTLPARDVFTFEADDARDPDKMYLVTKNPSHRIRQSWDWDFQG